MEGEAGEFQDWEVLHNSETVLVNPDGAGLIDSTESDEILRNFEGIEGDSEGMIRSDYFSLENQERYAKNASEVDSSEVESDNPSWIDPGSETRYAIKNSGEFWSDSSSDRSDERKLGDFDAKHELGLAETAKSQVGLEGIEEMKAKNENLGKLGTDESKFNNFDVKHELGSAENIKPQLGFEEFGEIQTQDKYSSNFWSDSGGEALVSIKFGDDSEDKRDESEISGDLGGGHSSIENKADAVAEIKSDAKLSGEGERRRIVWWKVPLEILKYYAFRVSPVWSFSVAAAVMGFVFLGRRLYKMKRKSQTLQLKVTVDDKKVSQFMTRAARLNEAFSVVRRVPIIRPSLPAGGVTPWPVMSLR
ncbi:hypothetical protein F2P56_021191 [Juglans regia]|uniref:Uncharacterized protein LOC108998863 isoform X1 n=2 Tax=Juglans regia TaxID=51240 RepID=A0A833TWA7_JUGRE|nr:uncharacterized protein LOC108998863 isoform X1 [Juglans regia]KAF5457056.1 hypothetical protein F2P56_021191 [Juglans regia]